ncbi:MAG: ribosome biogenesis GTP-binding protein YsxC [Candidatus Moranbacteria bacterium]|nr:ribosome biogenesis GTP-binding protein YsxC [Candidatus Moranbacteria bacterium]
MEIREVRFVRGVTGSEGLPEPMRPTVAFFGRSNVGKSSAINALVRRKGLARSSSRPGRTTEVNYFDVDGKWYLADTPGYGYARLSKTDMERIARRLSWFAGAQEVPIRLAVVVFDAALGLQDSDRETVSVLRDAGRLVLLLGNKSDKGRRNDVTNHIRQAMKEYPDSTVIRYSAETGEGRGELLAVIGGTIRS